jgi:membrane-associated protease RseP (regulator of RpoE activity)
MQNYRCNMTLPDQNILNSIITRIFRTDDVTFGNGKEYLVRYRGQLLAEDSAAAYDQLTDALRPYGLMPLFRKEDGGGQLIYLVPALATPKASNSRTNIILLILTFFSVIWAGMTYADPQKLAGAASTSETLWLAFLYGGIPFAVSMLSILLAHEFGHYLVGRYHKAAVSLPYFIPLPVIGMFGTMGAFINMKAPPKNKRILLDIAIAGPLAGLVVAIPVLLLGLSMSSLGTVENTSGGFIEGNSLLYLLAKFVIFGKWLPAPIDFAGMSPILYWLRYFFTGHPLPLGGVDVLISPVAFAGWAGLLVTALNLIPAGQLDGGHMLYVLFGKRLRLALPAILLLLGILGIFWSGWWLWMVILYFFGRAYAEPLDQITELDPPRRALAALGIIIFFLVFIPIPFVQF